MCGCVFNDSFWSSAAVFRFDVTVRRLWKPLCIPSCLANPCRACKMALFDLTSFPMYSARNRISFYRWYFTFFDSFLTGRRSSIFSSDPPLLDLSCVTFPPLLAWTVCLSVFFHPVWVCQFVCISVCVMNVLIEMVRNCAVTCAGPVLPPKVLMRHWDK